MFRREALPELPTEPEEPPAPPSPPPPSPPRAPSPTAIIRPPAPAYIRKAPPVRIGTSVAAPDLPEYVSIIPHQTADDRKYQQDLRQVLLASRHLARGFQPIDAANLPPLDLGGMVASSSPPPSPPPPPPPAENPAAPAQAPSAVANPIADVQVSQLEA